MARYVCRIQGFGVALVDADSLTPTSIVLRTGSSGTSGGRTSNVAGEDDEETDLQARHRSD